VLIVVAVAVVVIAALAFFGFRWLTSRGMYQPGQLASGHGLNEPLTPPKGLAAAGFFQVTPTVRLRTFAEGAGPTVVIVHGGPGRPPAGPWAAGTALRDAYHLVYYHQRGCGESSRPFDRMPPGSTWQRFQRLHGALGMPEQVADLERIRQLLGEERLTIVGHSFGALMAAAYAAEFPDRVAALVAIAPASLVVMPNPEGDLFGTIAARLPPPERAAFDAWRGRLFDFSGHLDRTDSELAELQAGMMPFYAKAAGLAPSVLSERASPGGFMSIAAYLSLGRSHDWRPVFARIRAPTLVVHGERDLQPLAATESFARAIPGSELVTVPGAGHFVFDEAPAELASLLRRFLGAALTHPAGAANAGTGG
jgi:proline iminopeptidase